MKYRFSLLITAIMMMVLLTVVSGSPRYKVVDLGTLGGNESAAISINNNGQILGAAQTSQGIYHSVLWSNGKITDLSPLIEADTAKWATNELTSCALSINEAGNTTGMKKLENGIFEAFLWNESGLLGTGDMGGDTIGWDLNNSEMIVGTVYVDNISKGFVWEKGKTTFLGTFGGTNTYAKAVNSLGQVTGLSDVNRPHPTIEGLIEGGSHAFLWENGEMRDLGCLAGGNSWGFDINDLGQVAGQSEMLKSNKSTAMHAALWDDGEIVDLGSLFESPFDNSIATSINNHTQIVGTSTVDLVPLIDKPGSYTTIECGFLWEDNELYNLNDLIDQPGKWQINMPMDINDNGIIVGRGRYSENGLIWIENRAFMLVPVKDTGEEIHQEPVQIFRVK